MKKYIILTILVFSISIIILCCSKKSNEEAVINLNEKNVKLEEYMIDMVLAEMKEYENYEAIKAFSVVVRSNLVNDIIKNNFSNKKNLNIYLENKEKKSTKKNVNIYRKVKNAIFDTKGEVLCYKDRVISVPYHKISSGETIDIIRGTNIKIPFLKKTICEEDRESKDYLNIEYYNYNKAYSNIQKVKHLLHNYQIEKMDDMLRVVVFGKGHGYGMSLYNANVLGSNGNNYKEILLKFFDKVKIIKVY